MKKMFDNILKKVEDDSVIGDANIKDILYLSRQDNALSMFFVNHLQSIEGQIMASSVKMVDETISDIVDGIVVYSKVNNINDFVIGVSGGADSSVTLALLNEAKKIKSDINIHAYTLSINQNEAEVERAKEVSKFLGIKMREVDLSKTYDFMSGDIEDNDISVDTFENRIRLGNIKARLRMMYLYDKARYHNGVVVSTDNFSEYMAGFWTINGDVGDFSPIQNYLKSVEVTSIGRELGLPENIWRATPTDGLGISKSDEDQLKMSYLEWDILAMRFLLFTAGTYATYENLDLEQPAFSEYVWEAFLNIDPMGGNDIDKKKALIFKDRVSNSWFKRNGPFKLENTMFPKTLFNDIMAVAYKPSELHRIGK